MIQAFLAAAGILFLTITVDYLGRKHKIRTETIRKIVHIVGGTFVATWPFFMSFKAIELLSLASIVVFLIVRHYKILGSLHAIERRSAGDILFGVGVGLSALISANKWIFAAAILHLSLADGLAGLIGTHPRSKHAYKIFGERRTVAGSLTFFLVSMAILGWVTHSAPAMSGVTLYMPWIAFLAAVVENLSVLGTDNIFVPLFIVFMLNSLR